MDPGVFYAMNTRDYRYLGCISILVTYMRYVLLLHLDDDRRFLLLRQLIGGDRMATSEIMILIHGT